jgi:hypothetical protein
MKGNLHWNQRRLISHDSLKADLVFTVPITTVPDATGDMASDIKSALYAHFVKTKEVWEGGQPRPADVVVHAERQCATVRVKCV